MLYILIDNGHGINTIGKRSGKLEDGSQLFEWKYTREIADLLIKELNKYPDKYKAIKITPEDKDISLTTRVNRINQYCRKYGSSNCIMISIHVNAAGTGEWLSARGWSAWTTKGQNISDKLADCLYDGADQVIKLNKEYIDSFKGQSKQKPIREDKTDGDRDCEANFQIIKGANCAAVLVEMLFMDNKKDVKYLLSNKGKEDMTKIYLNGIENYYNKYKKVA